MHIYTYKYHVPLVTNPFAPSRTLLYLGTTLTTNLPTAEDSDEERAAAAAPPPQQQMYAAAPQESSYEPVPAAAPLYEQPLPDETASGSSVSSSDKEELEERQEELEEMRQEYEEAQQEYAEEYEETYDD